MERTRAVFHEREHVDSAVRELTEEGIGEEHILIEPSLRQDVSAHEPTPRLSSRARFAGIGAAVGMISGVAIGGVGGGPLASVWLVIVGVLLGAILGLLVGLIVGALRREHATHAVGRDWIVSVDAPDETFAARARQVLRGVGGELLPSA